MKKADRIKNNYFEEFKMKKNINILLFIFAVVLFVWGSIVALTLDVWVGVLFISCSVFCFLIRKWKG
jgi:uncharacterized membrane protein